MGGRKHLRISNGDKLTGERRSHAPPYFLSSDSGVHPCGLPALHRRTGLKYYTQVGRIVTEMRIKLKRRQRPGKRRAALPAVFLLVLGVIQADVPSSEWREEQTRIQILTTVFPLKEFASAVGGSAVEVSLLLPPGAEIHTWRPRPSDIVKLSQADVFIYIGPALEPWVTDLLDSIHNPDLIIINASEELDPEDSQGGHEHEGEQVHEGMDPHIWLDFAHDQRIVRRLAGSLSEIRPEEGENFRLNAENYSEKLKSLDRKYHESLSRCQKQIFVLGGHAAFGYLARRYHLEQVALYGLSPDAAPTPGQMIDVVKLARAKGIRVIYFEVNVSPRMAQVLAEEIGAETRVLNPGVSPSKEELSAGVSFFDIMEKNLENLRYGLDCR
jgi:zinc transport system substrate-binding protein